MKGILLSLGILIPTILPSQIRLVPFPGIFSTYIGAHLSKRQFCLRPLSRGLFFNRRKTQDGWHCTIVFVPFLGDFFSIRSQLKSMDRPQRSFSSPFLGTFFQSFAEISTADGLDESSSPFSGTFFSKRACEAPARLLSQAHSRRGWEDRFIRHSPSEMKCRFSQAGRASAGICNEKIEMGNGGAAHKNMEPPRRFETSDFLVSQT